MGRPGGPWASAWLELRVRLLAWSDGCPVTLLPPGPHFLPCSFLSWSWLLLREASVAVCLWETEGLPSPQLCPSRACRVFLVSVDPPSTLSFCLLGNAPSFLWLRRKCRFLQNVSLGPCLGSLLFLVLSCSPVFSSPGSAQVCAQGSASLGRALREDLVGGSAALCLARWFHPLVTQ